MINKIKSYFNGFKVNIEVSTSTKSLEDLYLLLKEEYGFITHEDISNMSEDIKHTTWTHIYPNDFRIVNHNKKENRLAIEIILKRFPDAKVVSRYSSLEETNIEYNGEKYLRNESERMSSPINYLIAPSLKNILSKMQNNTSNSFQFLLDKYESTFLLLQSTILEIKEDSEIDSESESSIVDILNTFIDEYNSMEAVFEKRSAAYQEDIKNSINQRLQDELKFVSDRKTNWNQIEIEPKYESGIDLINKL